MQEMFVVLQFLVVACNLETWVQFLVAARYLDTGFDSWLVHKSGL